MNNLNLTLENFQSIKKAKFEFVEGLNLLVGESNSGKSATIRAIEAVLLNPSGSQRFITLGADKTSVLMEYNGYTCEWSRTKKESKYEINGEPYKKVGNTNLFKILGDKTGFVQDDKGNVLNIEGEWDILFPFDKSDTELFKLFENVFCVVDSTQVFQTFKQQDDILNKELHENNNQLNKDNAKLKAINEILDTTDAEALKKLKLNLESGYKKKDILEKDISVLNKIKPYLLLRSPFKKVNFDLLEIDNYIKIQEELTVLFNFQKLNNLKYNKKEFGIDAINKYNLIAKDIKTLKETIKLVKLKLNTKTFKTSEIEKYQKVKSDLDKVLNLSRLEELKIPSMKVDNVIESYSILKESLQGLRVKYKEIKKLEENSASIKKEIEEINKSLSKFNTCPTCNNIIGVD